MKFKILSLFVVAFMAFSVTSCREKTTQEKVEDAMEDVSKEIEKAAEDVHEAVQDSLNQQ